MVNNETKRQHYVPRTYLKHFSEKRGDEYFIKALPLANLNPDKIKELNIANVCLQKDLYTLPSDTAKGRMLLEHFYNDNLETHYDRIHQILIDPTKKTLSDEERHLIISTVVTMYYRTTKWLNSMNEFYDRILEQTYYLCQQTGKDYFIIEDQKVSIAGKSLEQLKKETKIETRPDMVITQLEVALKLIKLRSIRDGIYVSRLMDDGCEFQTSDNPVCCTNANARFIMPADPSNVLTLPLDNKHKLFLMPFADKGSKHLLMRHNVTGTFCFTEKLTTNHQQSKNAERFVLGTDFALKDFIRDKDKYDKPLTKEQEESFKKIEEAFKRIQDLEI